MPEQQSQLFSTLFERLSPGRQLRVLDVGRAVAEIVDFFGRVKSRLDFVDLFSELPIQQPDAEALSEQQLLEQFQQLLDFPSDTQFDICLFWDLFNYLDATALRAFCRALQPCIHNKTCGHGFVQRDSQKTPPGYRYGVLAENRLRITPCDRPLTRHCHSQAAVERELGCFTIRRGVLLLDGRLEFLLNAV